MEAPSIQDIQEQFNLLVTALEEVVEEVDLCEISPKMADIRLNLLRLLREKENVSVDQPEIHRILLGLRIAEGYIADKLNFLWLQTSRRKDTVSRHK